ncbi:NosD domain-containing protein [Clostridium sp. YIM B02569]|uniref:NosD domain-containing protein n=1 Tax=Clostridium sp. YIM B02569 TaxID=2911967 RepID=UPI001EE9BBA6|nr:NosD domain-containing protein [Clostridium sp. YIM B02569]
MAIQDLTASLDLKQNLNIYITCKQFDNLNLILNIFDNSVQANLTGYNVRLKAMKSDQVPLIQEHTGITINSNLVNINADEQLTTTAGDTPIELQFIDSIGNKKATFNLVLKVVPSVIAVSASISTATYTLLEELENKLDQATDYFENLETFQESHPDLLDLDNRVTETENEIENAKEPYSTLKDKLSTIGNDMYINVTKPPYNCTGLGVVDESEGLIQAFDNAISQGKTLYIPSGNYLIQNTIAPTMINNLKVLCDVNVKFIASSRLNNKIFHFNNNSSTYYSIDWYGGYIDGSAQPNDDGTSSTAWDAFYIGEYFDDVKIENLTIYAGADYEHCGSDSGIFAVAKNITIKNCTFIGVWDSAIYLSANSSMEIGEKAIINKCRFVKCTNGVISKRGFLNYIVTDNFFTKTKTAIATGVADLLLPGKQNIIANNIIIQPVVGIQVQISDYTVVHGNRIVDIGYNLNNSILTTGGTGIRISGSKDCIVNNNFIGMINYSTVNSNFTGISSEPYTFNSILYNSTDNTVSNNTIVGISVGIRESDSNQSSKMIFNTILGTSARYIKYGATSTFVGYTTESQNRIDMDCIAAIGGVYGSESLLVVQTPNAVNKIRIDGTVTGSAPIISSSGTDTNIDLSLSPKGTGNLKFGTYTATPGTITGYIAIKDSTGTIRKLAVIS